MAEGAILSSVLSVAQQTLGSSLVKGFKLISGVNKKLEKLESTFSTIQAVLVDAEERRHKDKALDNWLKKLRVVAYQVDNVLDEFRIEALRREAETGNHMFRKVRDFFSYSNQLIFKIRMGHKLKEVGDRLVSIAEERKNFHLSERVYEQRAGIGGRETFSFLDEPVIYGREGDKEIIINFLTTDIPNDEDVVSVISIVGMGGLGKTTLAKLVFNDTVVEKAFDLQRWVCVSDDFDVTRLIRLILDLESGNETLEQLQRRLREKLSGKKYLLVLDDVWNENPNKWETLRGLLQTGAKGSKIVVTTRSKRIGSMMGTVDNHNLKVLSDDDCWALFEKRAFKGKRKEDHPELVSIGKEIVKRCDGLPLAAKTLGSLMHSRETDQNEWIAIRDNEIWNSREDKCEILPALMLSYHHLPSHLKPCFVYCTLFPKDTRIDETMLIWLWMAEGLISSSKQESSQDIGKRYLKELVSWSLFQLSNDFYYPNCYCVHDLVHDLAKHVAGGACLTMQNDESLNIPQFCHCLALNCENTIACPMKFYRTETLRIAIFFSSWNLKKVSCDMFIGLKKLRALHFGACLITELPNSIGSLKHLRYINLSSSDLEVLPRSICLLRNLQFLELSGTRLTRLPTSIGRLQNLQILMLSYCDGLKSLPSSVGDLKNLNVLDLGSCEILENLPESMTRLQKLESLNLDGCGGLQDLPRGLSNMINLRYLDISDCKKLTHMPSEMGKLNRLEKLSTFIVDEEGGCSIAQLQHLNNIGGMLQVLNLGKLKDPGVVRKVNLKEKRNIRILHLCKTNCHNDEAVDDVAVDVLEGLEPPQSISELLVDGGIELPGWLKNITDASFPKLIDVSLSDFKGCKHLPPLGQLQHLERLKIEGMDSIEVIGRELCGNNGGVAFPLLKSIEVRRMPKLKKWLSSSEEEDEEDGIIGQQAMAFPCLTELNVYDCPELTSLPRLPSLQSLIVQESMKLLKSAGSLRGIGGNGSLKTLEIWGGENEGVMEGLRDLSSVEELTIRSFDEMDCVMESMRHLFSTVLRLKIWGCDSLSSLGEGLRGLTALRELSIFSCEELGCMPEYMGSLTSLQSLTIWGCPDLSRRCEREKGEDWHLISHIPNFNIYRKEGTDNRQSKKKAISVVKERLSACIPCSTSST